MEITNNNGLTSQAPRRERNYKRTPRREIKEQLERTVLQIRPVSKSTKGGRQRRFIALVLVKREKSIAFGYARGTDVATAISSAVRKASKRLVTYFAEAPRTLPYDFRVKFCATKILFFPAPPGSGIRAGETIKLIFKYLGIKDVSTKIIDSNNMLNVVKCTFKALDKITKRRNNW